jgi:hypothetical protein
MDDIPLFLCASRAEAVEVAEEVQRDPQAALDRSELDWPKSSLQHLDVVMFQGGRPVGVVWESADLSFWPAPAEQ